MVMSAYDRWKTTDPNDGDQELFEKFYEEYWDDPETVFGDMVEYFTGELEYLIYEKKEDPDPQENHWYTPLKQSFVKHHLPYLIERMVEDAKSNWSD